MGRESVSGRRKYVLTQVAEVTILGLAYYVISGVTGLYIPCVFRALTGLKCPGCGITHYAVAMLHGRTAEAFAANQLVFCLVPVLLLYAAYRAVSYVRKGNTGFSRIETVGLFIVLIITIAFGVARNL